MDTSHIRKPRTAWNSARAQIKTCTCCDPTRFVRIPEQDRRIGRGNDFAGDAWLDRHTGQIVYGAVGVDRNATKPSITREIVSIAVVVALLAVLMVDSIVGMSSGFAPSSEVGYTLAGVGDDGR